MTGLAATCAALALASVAMGAYAQPRTSTPAVNPFSSSAFGDSSVGATSLSSAPQRKSLQWDTKGRWGLKFDYQQPAPNGPDWREMDVGPVYKLSPRFHIAGTVGVTEQPQNHFTSPDQSPQPRVRLETTFKF
jgi:hypothetical protein